MKVLSRVLLAAVVVVLTSAPALASRFIVAGADAGGGPHVVIRFDADNNGVQDIRFCFTKTAMAPLFDHLHGNSPKTVQMLVSGLLNNGSNVGGSVLVTLYLHQ